VKRTVLAAIRSRGVRFLLLTCILAATGCHTSKDADSASRVAGCYSLAYSAWTPPTLFGGDPIQQQVSHVELTLRLVRGGDRSYQGHSPAGSAKNQGPTSIRLSVHEDSLFLVLAQQGSRVIALHLASQADGFAGLARAMTDVRSPTEEPVATVRAERIPCSSVN
jgi:hypothetical protein